MKKPIEEMLGKQTDTSLSRLYGVEKTKIFRMRKKLGIPAYKTSRPGVGNKTGNRGHRKKGTTTNDLSPYVAATLREAREFFAKHELPPSIPNPNSIKRCAAETGLSDSALRAQLKGRYIPSPKYVALLKAWIDSRKSERIS